MPPSIEPRLLQGFRDYPPALMMPRERVLQAARVVYRSYGYAPIDTPALEFAEVLLGKGGGENDKLVYRFRDQGDRDVALRFDLTVPFARFAAMHVPQLGVPFKRYAMGPVWRGERPGQGRYREFWQCDFDTIGTTSNASDIEVALVICDLFAALGIERFTLRINNRLVLSGLLEAVGLAGRAVPVLRALDKLAKVGREAVIAEMVEQAGATAEQADAILVVAEVEGSNAERLDRVLDRFGTNATVQQGAAKLRELLGVLAAAGIPPERVAIDLSIARGLDYYTGTIYETSLDDLPQIGSVCSGGRYDDLAGLYTKQILPGVGASLGVDRLLAAMEQLEHPWMTERTAPSPVLIVQFDAKYLGDYQRVGRMLRSAGIGAEVYPEAKKPKAQFEYADKRGFRVAVIAGGDEFARGTWKVKDLAKREEIEVPEAELVERVMSILG